MGIFKDFLSNKRYFIYRFSFVVGFLFLLYATLLENNLQTASIKQLLNVLCLLGSWLVGMFITSALFFLSDLFCKEKTFSLIEKANTDNYEKKDLLEVLEALYINKKISSDIFQINKYLLTNEPNYLKIFWASQGENFPPYNIHTEENNKKRKNFLQKVIEYLKQLDTEKFYY